MILPQALFDSLRGIAGYNEEKFVAVHESDEQITSVRFNPAKMSEIDDEWPVIEGSPPSIEPIKLIKNSIPWASNGYYLSARPSFTFDPLFHAGTYYVQEASGMFLEQALQQTLDLTSHLKVLDLCAAPGGKSTHIQSLISQQVY